MATAPQVQDLNTLIGQYQNTLAPQQAVLDTQITANDTSGAQQTQGLDAKKDTAFKGITQAANDRGGYFSGFAPNEQATYTAGTYLPALASLQSTIASTRSNLLGKKADLTSQGNSSALGEFNTEKTNLQKWQEAQDAQAHADAAAAADRAFQASENAKNRSATAALSAAKVPQPTQAQIKQADIGAMGQTLKLGNQQLGIGHAGGDTFVSPQNYLAAKQAWVNNGYSSKEFDDVFSNYRNPNNPNYKVG